MCTVCICTVCIWMYGGCMQKCRQVEDAELEHCSCLCECAYPSVRPSVRPACLPAFPWTLRHHAIMSSSIMPAVALISPYHPSVQSADCRVHNAGSELSSNSKTLSHFQHLSIPASQHLSISASQYLASSRPLLPSTCTPFTFLRLAYSVPHSNWVASELVCIYLHILTDNSLVNNELPF
jgi:hypothetical protein